MDPDIARNDPRLNRRATRSGAIPVLGSATGRAVAAGGPESGNALLAMVVLLALVLCALGWWVTTPRSAPPERLDSAAHTSDAARPTTSLERSSASALEPGTTSATRASGSSASDRPATSEPTSVSGSVLVRAMLWDGSAPSSWTLDVEDVALARDATSPRVRVDVIGSETTVARRVPAVHRFCAHARRLASRTRSVTLDATNTTAIVELVLEPAGQVSGSVLDDAGQPAAGRAVWLRAALDPTTLVPPSMDLETATLPGGQFLFAEVPPGRWSVLVGDRQSPLARRADVDVTLAGSFLEPIRLPRLYPLLVRVLEESGAPARDARVWSRGTNGGVFDTLTDASGLARAVDLPAGRYRVYAQADTGRSNLNVVVPAERLDDAVTLTLRGRP